MFSAFDTVSADSSIIYVNDSGGNDDWDGQYAEWQSGTLFGPKKSIKNATGTVTSGGIVNIADGTYTGKNNTNIIINKNMTIKGQSRDGTIINGAKSAQIFQIQNDKNVTIANLTLANGNAYPGGAILNYGNLTVENGSFIGNNATYGGAILNLGNLTVIDSCFSANNATSSGAISNSGTLNIKNTKFNGNTAGIMGGAIYNAGDLTVSDSDFTDNIAIYGGAIYNYADLGISGNLSVKNCTFIGNKAIGTASEAFGGAVFNFGTLIIDNSTFASNSAINGGAIYNGCNGNLTVIDSTFASNNATNASSTTGGGAISNDGNLTVDNVIFNDNNGGNFGGAIVNGGSLTIKGSDFIHNNANAGGAIHNNGNLDVNGSNFTSNKASNTTNTGTGGAILNGEKGNLTVKNSKFTFNIANYGGTIFNWYKGNLTVENSNFTANNATYWGGAIYNTGGNMTINGSNFAGNGATDKGGAIFNYYGNATVNFNRIVGNTASLGSAIYDGSGKVDASLNWWGSNINPSSKVCGHVIVTPWLVLSANANPATIKGSSTSIITVDLLHDNLGNYHVPALAHVLDGITVNFKTNLGNISSSFTVNGIAKSIFKAGSVTGTANISAIIDNQKLSTLVKIDTIPPKVTSTYPKRYATGVSRTMTIYLKFSEKIKASINWSKIYIKNLKTGKLASISKSISGNTLKIKMSSKRYAYNWYQIYIPKSAVKDSASNNLAAGYTLKFKTGKY